MTQTTLTQAFAVAPTSTEKTALLVDFNALLSELDTAQAGGAYTTQVAELLKSHLIDFAEEVASNMQSHTD